MGAHLFVQFACSACHGLQGNGKVSKYVPALQPIHSALTVAALTRIITNGLGESANPKKPYMPVWGPVISKSQVADLVAYIRAGLPKVQFADPVPVPRNQGPAVEGSALYVRYGCINCHGPNGLGGVPNPQAADKAIPRARRSGLPQGVQLGRQDHRDHQNRQRDRQAADREHAALGRDHSRSQPARARRLPEDAEVAAARRT